MPGREGGEGHRQEGVQLLSREAPEAEAATDSTGGNGGDDAGCWPFPAEECGAWWAIDGCESGHGTHPRTYDLDAENGGRLQVNKTTWERFLFNNYAWTWEMVVLDDVINREAAYVIWTRAGGSWSPWTCAQLVLS